MATRTAEATWNGDLPSGNGTMRFGGGAYEGSYSAQSRFEEGEGTNPEELIAAAQAGCFSMAFANELAKAGHDPRRIETTAAIGLRMRDDKPTIDRIKLTTRAEVPGIAEDEFQRIADEVKTGCIVSRALAAVETFEIDATLES